jgi:hypothetical protein
MKSKFGFVLAWIAVLLLTACATDGGAYSGTLIVEGRHIYSHGDILNGVLVIVDGEVILEDGANVRGQVFMLGGTAEINAVIDQDISIVGGDIAIGPEAIIGGDFRVGGGEYEIAPGATIEGAILTGPASNVELDDFFPRVSAGERLVQLLPWSLVLAFLAYLAARSIPAPVSRVSQTEIGHPVVSAAMGILVGVVGPVLLVFMAFTLILIPVTVIGLVLGALMVAYGWIGFGMAFGKFLVRRFNLEVGRGGSAFLGTLAFIILIDVLSVIPFIGPLVSLLAATIALGAVVLTRFGLRQFVPATDLIYEEDEV